MHMSVLLDENREKGKRENGRLHVGLKGVSYTTIQYTVQHYKMIIVELSRPTGTYLYDVLTIVLYVHERRGRICNPFSKKTIVL